MTVKQKVQGMSNVVDIENLILTVNSMYCEKTKEGGGTISSTVHHYLSAGKYANTTVSKTTQIDNTST